MNGYFLLASADQPDMTDLIIFPGPERPSPETAETTALLSVRGVGFDGSVWGIPPDLSPHPDGFRLSSEHSGVGRFNWSEILVVTHADGTFWVTSYVFSSFDRAVPDYFTCRVNLITGAYARERERGDLENPDAAPEVTLSEGMIDAGRLPLADWGAASSRPAICATAPLDPALAAPD